VGSTWLPQYLRPLLSCSSPARWCSHCDALPSWRTRDEPATSAPSAPAGFPNCGATSPGHAP